MMRMHIEVNGHLCMRVLIDCIWSMFQCDSAHLRCRVSMPRLRREEGHKTLGALAVPGIHQLKRGDDQQRR